MILIIVLDSPCRHVTSLRMGKLPHSISSGSQYTHTGGLATPLARRGHQWVQGHTALAGTPETDIVEDQGQN